MTDKQENPETQADQAGQSDQVWEIGGQDRQLSEEEQLDQLYSYLQVHYPLPDFRPPWAGGGSPDADRYCALLPDRITQASMMVLGTAVDHSLPGTKFTDGITQRDTEVGAIFEPTAPNGKWAVSLHSGGWWRGDGNALEMQWRPEVAAAAQLSGTTIIDVDYPLAPEHTVADMVESVNKAIAYAREQGAASVTVWGYSSGGALAALAPADALLLTFPDFAALSNLPDEIRAGYELPTEYPRTLVQTAVQDEIAERVTIPGAETADYVSTHRISTPAVARQRIMDTADFLRSV
ncbi:alpha/beta hydrolase [Corynebacterium striatum]|uniref:alpha/beta hydrolase n=1 Tax=Corynebacterium striatum TaxID=43770 RepID=UPI00066682C9|nr:alpha/beta hydrolase [Corynebacterium striatum]MDK8881461.1 alpha/beta hydrolase [Corynebacterium striatum]VFB05824.1 alpha/beta hydrolase family protein [Corynebacterium striatum]HAT1134151.1 alpha/beta hydrolase fold domain-containing protein [Corynebacterium striatum]HAT1156859.1 alpha/beta hydrolase fold domain-containing protein [Corynebacterium striatum]HAT1159738.1 alpha/beta hydrolase fold domain-containing protein [Corynebacterium striatum]